MLAKKCARCRQERYFLNADGICDECREISAQAARRERISNVILTTSIDVPGRMIESVAGIVATETALGVSILKDIANNWRDFVGGRSQTAQNSLKEARTICLSQLKQDAFDLGADAVIAIDLDYNELTTSGNGILFVAASGTAVKLKPLSEAAE